MNAIAHADWPPTVFDAPALRGLDPRARAAIARAGRVVDVADGAVVYREGDASDSFFVVIAGSVALQAIRRGDEAASVLRVARRGDSFGEEAALPGMSRRATARATAPTTVAEIPVPVFQRAVGRAGVGRVAERDRRYLRRAATADFLASSAFARELPRSDVDALLDAAALERVRRGTRIYETGDRAGSFFLLLDGLVQIQTEIDGRVSVVAYLARGDFFGDAEILAAGPRDAAAVAVGDAWCARIPGEVLRGVSDRNPGLFSSLRRIARQRRSEHLEVVGPAATNTTQHVFRDLYRMQVARSLLVIDQDSCVRCGHCAWTCADVHGVSRLVRRGDKVLTRLRGGDGGRAGATATSLLLPNSCQHCRNAACMIDCPTGAIGRDLGGEVFIREELCTGCGNCAKACPWQNIQLAPRPAAASASSPGRGPVSAEVAVKCDLCRDHDGPACVQACPTEAIFRLDPSRDIAEVSRILGSGEGPGVRRETGGARAWMSVAVAASVALGGIGLALQRAGVWLPGSGAGLLAGLLAGALVLAATGYAVPKRLARLWRGKRGAASHPDRPRGRVSATDGTTPAPRSRTRPHLLGHMTVGLAAAVCAVSHGGWRLPASPAGALYLAFWITAALGGAGALLYWLVPRRLTRIERRGSLPEDLGGERRALLDRLYLEASGTSDLVKAIVDNLLVPYTRAWSGPLALLASGRSLVEERARLRGRVDAILGDRGAGRLAGLDEVIRTVVELRALPARRWLTAALRAWLPLHIVATAVALAMLGIHVLTAVLA